jgi:hypothetical protein
MSSFRPSAYFCFFFRSGTTGFFFSGTGSEGSGVGLVGSTVGAGALGTRIGSWVGLVAPANTPADIVRKIQRDVADILNDKEVADKLNQQGALPVGDTPEEFTLYIKNEIVKWGKVVRDANIKAD